MKGDWSCTVEIARPRSLLSWKNDSCIDKKIYFFSKKISLQVKWTGKTLGSRYPYMMTRPCHWVCLFLFEMAWAKSFFRCRKKKCKKKKCLLFLKKEGTEHSRTPIVRSISYIHTISRLRWSLFAAQIVLAGTRIAQRWSKWLVVNWAKAVFFQKKVTLRVKFSEINCAA